MKWSKRKTGMGVFLLIAGSVLLAWLNSTRPPVPLRVFQVTTNQGFYGGVFELFDGTIVATDYVRMYGLNGDGERLWDVERKSRQGSFNTIEIVGTRSNTVFAAYRGTGGNTTKVLAAFEEGRSVWELSGTFMALPLYDRPNNAGTDGIYFMNSGNVVAVDFEGTILWTRPTFSTKYRSPVVAPNGDILFRDSTNNVQTQWIRRWRSDGTTRWQRASAPDRGGPVFAPDGTFYWGGGTNRTLTAFDPDGEEIWRLARPEWALSSPVLGPDGTIHFTARTREQTSLLAVSPDGELKWLFPLGWGNALKPPVIRADGTIYLVTGDRLVRAISPEGELLWKYQVPKQMEWKPPTSWKGLSRQFRQRFGLRKNELFGVPLISSKGVLYVNFNHTGCLYAFDLRSMDP